jgi:hypothetical protein
VVVGAAQTQVALRLLPVGLVATEGLAVVVPVLGMLRVALERLVKATTEALKQTGEQTFLLRVVVVPVRSVNLLVVRQTVGTAAQGPLRLSRARR